MRLVFSILHCASAPVVRDHWADLAAKRGNSFVLANEAKKVSESVLVRAESLGDTLFGGGATNPDKCTA